MAPRVEISHEEVRAIACYPHRLWLGLLCLLAVSVAVSTIAAMFTLSIPVIAEPERFDLSRCSSESLSEPCLSALSPELQRIPNEEQYIRWRMFDVVSDLERSTQDLPGETVDRQVLFTNASYTAMFARSEIEGKLPELSPGPYTTLPERLIALGQLRDWSEASPPLRRMRSAEEIALRPTRALDIWGGVIEDEHLVQIIEQANLAIHQQGRIVVNEFAATLGSERDRMYQTAWQEKMRVEASAQRQRLEDYEFALALWRLLAAVSAVMVLVSVASGGAWIALGPRVVDVGLHRLRFGRHEIPWSEVIAVDWHTLSVQTSTRAHPLTLGRRVLPSGASAELASAVDAARERAKTLAPLDRRALAAVQQLRS